MAFRAGSYLLVLCVISAMVQGAIAKSEGSCWSTWSRCSKWSRWGTGILWKNCNERCIDLGYSGGRCEKCPSTCWLSNRAWQCRCNGTPSC